MQMSIGLSFPGNLQDESVICYLCKNYNINLKIIEASFSTTSGWAILQFEGEKEEIERSFEYMVDKGIKIQQIQSKGT